MNAIATLEPTRLPIPMDVAKKYDLSQTQWRVLTDQIFPSAKTIEAVVMAIEYCRARKLDIYKRPIHIVPMWSAAKGKMVETCWPGISEIRTTAARTGQYVGKDETKYGQMVTRTFEGVVDSWENKQKVQKKVTKEVTFPEWASVVVYRLIGGQPRAFHTKIYWLETYGTLKGTDIPNDMWTKRPIGQFDKCLEAAALRQAFPEEVGNDLVAEEMEGRTIEGTTVEHAPAPVPPKPPVPPSEKKVEVVDAEVVDMETGEVLDSRESAIETGGATDALVDEAGAEEGADYFTRLERALHEASNATEIAEVWTDFDPLSKFEGNDESQAAALSMKREHVKRVGTK